MPPNLLENRFIVYHSKNENILQRIDLSNWRSSSKVEALVEELTRTRAKDPNAKSLVFSQFVNFLDLIEWRLHLSGFKCVKLDGRMSIHAKNILLRHYRKKLDLTNMLQYDSFTTTLIRAFCWFH